MEYRELFMHFKSCFVLALIDQVDLSVRFVASASF